MKTTGSPRNKRLGNDRQPRPDATRADAKEIAHKIAEAFSSGDERLPARQAKNQHSPEEEGAVFRSWAYRQ